jgi:hypothetical protein
MIRLIFQFARKRSCSVRQAKGLFVHDPTPGLHFSELVPCFHFDSHGREAMAVV